MFGIRTLKKTVKYQQRQLDTQKTRMDVLESRLKEVDGRSKGNNRVINRVESNVNKMRGQGYKGNR